MKAQLVKHVKEVKKVKIEIKDINDIFEDVKETIRKIGKGEKLKPVKEPEIYFTSFEAFRKALTPKKLELLHIIKTKKPQSINELARMAKRDFLKLFAEVGKHGSHFFKFQLNIVYPLLCPSMLYYEHSKFIILTPLFLYASK